MNEKKKKEKEIKRISINNKFRSSKILVSLESLSEDQVRLCFVWFFRMEEKAECARWKDGLTNRGESAHASISREFNDEKREKRNWTIVLYNELVLVFLSYYRDMVNLHATTFSYFCVHIHIVQYYIQLL